MNWFSEHHPDSAIVVTYFVGVFIAGALLAKRYAKRTADEFLTGGKTFTWRQTALTMVAFAVDPTYMGMAGIAFIWGLYTAQWTAVHIWFTSWFAAMFLVPIYWRTKIVTTPEYLERRFNAKCRALFSVLMSAILIVILTSALYLGSLLLQELLGWGFWPALAFIAIVCGFYVIMGGLRAVLTLDVYQGAFLLLTLGVIVWRVMKELGGVTALAAIDEVGKAGTSMPSMLPPFDFSPTTETFFPAQAIVLWSTIAGVSWLACNFGTAQRLLASRSERDAQKSLLAVAVLANVACIATFLIGVAMQAMKPGLEPDKAFIEAMLTLFQPGLRGLLVAGMMAALLSSADGLLTASGTLLTQDIYLRFLKPQASEKRAKNVTRMLEAAALLASIALIPLIRQWDSAVEFVQNFFGDVLGVVVALYIVGIFSKRATPKAAFIAMVFSIALAVGIDVYTPLNFAYVGLFSFVSAVVVTLALSRLEPAPTAEKLRNLTIHTLEDARGPWVGLKAWPALWKWALALALGWFTITGLWEWFIRTR